MPLAGARISSSARAKVTKRYPSGGNASSLQVECCIDNIRGATQSVAVRDQFTADGIVLDNAIAYWVHRVYQATRNASFATLRAAGEEITPEQWIVLVRLWEQDGRTQTELGESTYRDRPTMSRILDGMERRGLVKRKRDPDHGRVWMWSRGASSDV